jgi:hypothetical protein
MASGHRKSEWEAKKPEKTVAERFTSSGIPASSQAPDRGYRAGACPMPSSAAGVNASMDAQVRLLAEQLLATGFDQPAERERG